MQEGTDFDLVMFKDRFLNFRIILILLFKIAVVIASLYLAFLVRFDFSVDASNLETYKRILPPILFIKIAVFWRMGLSRGWWRYASLADALDILKATVLASAIIIMVVLFSHSSWHAFRNSN